MAENQTLILPPGFKLDGIIDTRAVNSELAVIGAGQDAEGNTVSFYVSRTDVSLEVKFKK